MERLKGYKLSNMVISEWEMKLFPAYDLLFFRREPDYLAIEELKPDSGRLFSLDDKTTFATWAVSNEAKYFTYTSNEDFKKLNTEQRKEVIEEQWLLGRGMVLPKAVIRELLHGLDEDSVEETLHVLETSSFSSQDANEKVFMIQNHLWQLLSTKVKTQFVVNYASMWTEHPAIFTNMQETIQRELIDEYKDISPFFDTFSPLNGPNCLAAVAAAFTGNTPNIYEWMQPETFTALLKQYGYRQIDSIKLEKRDVLVWKDKYDQVVHSAFLLNSRFCFNKNGQTMFNPWQISYTQDVISTWNNEHYRMQIYRVIN